MSPVNTTRRDVIIAGHRGDVAFIRRFVSDTDPDVRASSLSALERSDALTVTDIATAFGDDSAVVRRRAAEAASKRRDISLMPLLHDKDSTVVEIAAWACGEQEGVDDAVLERIIELATDAEVQLVREASAAALGAIGDQRGLAAILRACNDKPQVRRRAVLALAPFDGDDVEAAIERALVDRDWQVRQAAEDLRRATGEIMLDTPDPS